MIIIIIGLLFTKLPTFRIFNGNLYFIIVDLLYYNSPVSQRFLTCENPESLRESVILLNKMKNRKFTNLTETIKTSRLFCTEYHTVYIMYSMYMNISGAVADPRGGGWG